MVELRKGQNQLGLARFFVIHNKRACTLTALVLDHVDTEVRLVVTDELRDYVRLVQGGYNHVTVNHSENLVRSNPEVVDNEEIEVPT